VDWHRENPRRKRNYFFAAIKQQADASLLGIFLEKRIQ
jgi:hypothetical protein